MDTKMKKQMSAFGRRGAFARPPAHSEFLSRGEVARLFGVSVSTVTRWARTGLLPAVRTPGGHYRYHAEHVRRAAAAGQTPVSNVD